MQQPITQWLNRQDLQIYGLLCMTDSPYRTLPHHSLYANSIASLLYLCLGL